jgi:predicted phosphodiesterase
VAKLGLIADTHDEMAYIGMATGLFLSEGCTAVFHCGDIGQVRALQAFAPLTAQGIQLYWIPGDHDVEIVDHLRSASQDIGAFCLTGGDLCEGEATVQDMTVGLVHNPYGGRGQRRPFLLERWCRRRSSNGHSHFQLIVYGHLHYFHVKYPSTKAPTAVVCPGSCRRDAVPRTVAVFDTETSRLAFYSLADPRHGARLAFTTALVVDPAGRRLRAAPGLDAAFADGVSRNLEDPRRKYWRVNDHWGEEWIEDWLDPTSILSMFRDRANLGRVGDDTFRA